VTRAQAERLVAKLDALAAPGSGAYPGERDAARAKASTIRARHGLDRPAPQPRQQARPRSRSARPAWTAPSTGAAWAFDVKTQKHTPNVKVHHYTDPSNWRIEITDW